MKKKRRSGDEEEEEKEKKAKEDEGKEEGLLAIGEDVGEGGNDVEDENAKGDVVDPPGDGTEELLGIALLVHQHLQQHNQHQLSVHRHRRYHVDETQPR